MSWQCPLEIVSAQQKRQDRGKAVGGKTGGRQWVHLKGATVWLVVEMTRLELGGPFVLFGTNGVRNKRSHLVGPLFPAFKARFSDR